jgi:dihydrofolate reductase
MIVSLIVAMDEQRGIGVNNRLPWRLPADLKRFKALTMGRHLIVGRKTYDSIGRPLPGRKMVVITRNPGLSEQSEALAYVHSLDAALALAKGRGESEAFVGGGADIFAQALGLADRLYLTVVHTTTQADTFFPVFEAAVWQTQESHDSPADEDNPFAFTWELMIRA